MTLRNARSRFAASAGAGAALAAFGKAMSAADIYTLRINMALGTNSIMGGAMLRWAAAVQRRSNGRLAIEVFPNNQLERELASIDALRNGTYDLTIQASTILSNSFPHVRVFDLPFLFRNIGAAYRLFDSQIGEELFAEMAQQGVMGLVWSPQGFRQFETTGKAIHNPDDMKGLRLRIQPSPVFVAMARALGALPVTIDFGETYVALRQHIVDGLDTTLDAIVDAKMYDVLRYVAFSNHIFTSAPLLMNKAKFDSLPRDLQTILKEESRAVNPYWRDLYQKRQTANVETMKRQGAAFSGNRFRQFPQADGADLCELSDATGERLGRPRHADRERVSGNRMGELAARRTAYAMGAEVTGIDLRRPLDDATFDAVKRTWLEHIVLSFPDQDLTPEELTAFASRFGPLDDNRRAPHNRHPDINQVMILENKRFKGGTTKRVPDTWHSDLSYTDRPSSATFLNSKVLPDVGGATQFVNTYMAYETLSAKTQALIEPLWAVHDATLGPTFKRAGPELAEEIRRLNPPVAHPVVTVHPETGRKSLYLGTRTRNFAGMTEEESRPLLDLLNEHAIRYEFMYRHRWQLHEVVMWDNRCALHFAAKDYDTAQLRRMLRCSVLGPVRVPAEAAVPAG